MPRSDDWKQKYLSQLDDHEKMEARWQAERHSLQRLLVRASLVAEGQDPAVDKLLAELRDLARLEEPDLNALQRLQQSLENKVAGFDEGRNQALSKMRDSLKRMVASLEARCQRDQRRSLRQFEKRVAGELSSFSTLPPLLAELAGLQEQVLRLQGENAPKNRSVMQRLFGSSSPGKEPEVPEHRPSQPEMMDDSADRALASAGNLDLDTGEESGSGDLDAFGHQLSQLVRQLIAQVTLPRSAYRRAQKLQEQALTSVGWEQMRDLLDEVAQLVVSAVGRGQREFEGFLASLDERLLRIQSQFGHEALDVSQWRTVTEEFDKQLHDELDEIGQDVSQAKALPELQQSVRGHVERLNATLDDYRKTELERESLLQEQVSSLQVKISAMEEQSRAVQEELKKERVRATTDLLTQLPNRDGLEERLQTEFERWQRYGNPVSLAVVDIDHFKVINDTYGHLAGDKVLQLIAKALRDNLRKPDFVARYGGEEFVVLFPETPEDVAFDVIEKVRERIRALPFHFRGERVEVTFSAGVLSFQPVDHPSELFDIADRALYQAKNEGRDRSIRGSSILPRKDS